MIKKYHPLNHLAYFAALILVASFAFSSRVLAADSGGKWITVGSMSAGRVAHGATLLQDGKVLVTGSDGGTFLSSSELYDPATRSWSPTGSMATARALWASPGMVTLRDGRAMVAAGEGAVFVPLASTEFYDPATGLWSAGPNVSRARFRSILTLLPDGRVLLAGGDDGASHPLSSAEIFDPTTNTWTNTTPLNRARSFDGPAFVTLSDGRILVAGGSGSGAENTAEVYDPTTEMWTLSTLPHNGNAGTFTLLPSGKVLSAGGASGNTVLPNAALYDPASNSWTPVSQMATARAQHQAILLADGKVLVFGGHSSSGVFLNSSEIFDPATNQWSAGPPLPSGMSEGVVVKLQNGDYLAFGGNAGNLAASTSTYLFTGNRPVIGTIVGPTAPLLSGSTVNMSADFTDADTAETHTATWNWGNGTTTPGTVTEANGSGTVTGSFTYTSAGVYPVTLTVTDPLNISGQQIYQYVVIYNPANGYTTGKGRIDSPTGALSADPSATGVARMGFNAAYLNGATVPSGDTKFDFKVGSFAFQSTAYQWLVVNGAKAQFQGTGTVNGTGSYSFAVTVIDGSVSGTHQDLFRIRIVDAATNSVVYDTNPGLDVNADPTLAISGGSIKVRP